MKALWLIPVVAAVAAAQEAAPAQEPKPAEAAPQEAAAQPAQEAPQVPPATVEKKLSGEVDTGYRWVQDVGGNSNVYRSIVNLGEGPKLFTGNVVYRSPGGKYIDRFEIVANSWGGEPYNTGRLEASRAGAYRLRLDYRNVSYFNSLPSFANPLLSEGVFLS